MGYDCTNFLNSGNSFKEVEDFLVILGYRRYSKGSFFFYNEADYLSFSGISANLNTLKNDEISVDLHTQIFANKYDVDQLNFTAKQLRSRFGGYFSSDFGKNRYIKIDDIQRNPDEAGCYRAYFHFENNISRVFVYTNYVKFDVQLPPIGMFPAADSMNPIIISNNLVIPFLVSIIEDYYKSSYISILKYHSKKERIIKNSKFYPDDLTSISNNELSIEDALARSKSFQNINKIARNFNELDKNIDLFSVLKKPYRRRKETLFDSLDKFFEKRHSLIHNNQVVATYTKRMLEKDINNVEESIKRSYNHFIDVFGWQPYPY